MANEKPLQENLGTAVLHVLYQLFVYFLFIVPFDLWKKAVLRLADQKEKDTLSIKNITSLWPFFSFLKAFLLEFLFDGLILLSYLIGVLLAVAILINGGDLSMIIAQIILGYYLPVIFTIYRDLFQLCLLPIRKFIDWAKKPAQYMDLDIKNK